MFWFAIGSADGLIYESKVLFHSQLALSGFFRVSQYKLELYKAI
jgi:hypothetical protein